MLSTENSVKFSGRKSRPWKHILLHEFSLLINVNRISFVDYVLEATQKYQCDTFGQKHSRGKHGKWWSEFAKKCRLKHQLTWQRNRVYPDF